MMKSKQNEAAKIREMNEFLYDPGEETNIQTCERRPNIRLLKVTGDPARHVCPRTSDESIQNLSRFA